jgi:hypothetical protein
MYVMTSYLFSFIPSPTNTLPQQTVPSLPQVGPPGKPNPIESTSPRPRSGGVREDELGSGSDLAEVPFSATAHALSMASG